MSRAKRGESRSQSQRVNPIALPPQFGRSIALAFARCSDLP